jgi:hypothetical protein
VHPEAASLSLACRAALERECLAAVGSELTVLTVAITTDELKRFALDPVSGFLLSLTDGSLTVEAILDASGLPRLLALRHLRNLLDRGILSVASGYRRPPTPLGVRPWADGEITIESMAAPSNARLDAVPVLLVPREGLDVLGSETLAWRLLSLVDDARTVHEILGLTKTDAADGVALFERLAAQGLVALLQADGEEQKSAQPRWPRCFRRGAAAGCPTGGYLVLQTAIVEANVGCRVRSSARVLAGSIVEVRVGRLANVGDVAALHAQVVEALRRAGPRPVICADHRHASPLSREVADAWSRVIRQNNASGVRAGLLLGPSNAMYNLQIERVVRCAGNPARRLFADIDPLRDWIGGPLSEPERRALDDLFSDRT